MPIYTVGHSRHSVGDFIALLRSFEITVLVDVRLSPASRANPQFNRDTFSAELKRENIEYLHAPQLGGAPPGASGGIFHNLRTESGKDMLERLLDLGGAPSTSTGSDHAVWSASAPSSSPSFCCECHPAKMFFDVSVVKSQGGAAEDLQEQFVCPPVVDLRALAAPADGAENGGDFDGNPNRSGEPGDSTSGNKAPPTKKKRWGKKAAAD
eukprot:g9992.t1